MNLSVIDIIFLILITIFIIRCYLRGFISELMPIAGIVLGVLAALYFYKNGGDFLRNKFWPDMKTIPEVMAFVGLFLLVYLIFKLLEYLLNEIVDGIQLGSADRFLGVIFGLAEGIAVVSLILFLLRIQPLFDASLLLSESVFARLLLPLITGPENITNV